MRRVAATWLGLLVGALACSSGCVTSVYQCANDTECGTDGFCEASGYCSFADGGCASGRRYGAFAGEALGDTCVAVPEGSTGAVGSTSSTPDLPSSSGPVGTTTTGDPGGSTSPIVSASGTESTSEGPSGEVSSTGTDGATSTGTEPGRIEDGLVVDYRFDEGAGTTLHDSAPVDPPIDLTLEGDGYAWLSDGLRFEGDALTMAASTTSVTKVNQACQASNELTVEVWVTPFDVEMSGPPRLVTYSIDSGTRNVSLLLGRDVAGEQEPALRGRVRTTSLNGLPETDTPASVAFEGTPTHVVFVRNASGLERLFVDGEVATETTRAGDFSSWDTSGEMRLALGNEVSLSRPLDGALHLVAIYCRALDEAEVGQNFAVGY